MNRPPIIIMGMHRSGTALLTRMLESLGLFVGWKKEGNHEAVLFFNLNNWLLSQASASWDNPSPFGSLLERPDLIDPVTRYLKGHIGTIHAASYLGIPRYILDRSVFRISRPWGWKDPRNTITLPVWLRLFPDARVICVERHGVDVANSLRVRQGVILRKRTERLRRGGPSYWLRPRRDGFTDSLRCRSLEGGFSLWEEYMREGRRHIDSIGDSGLVVRFEELLRAPEEILSRIVSFCELECTPGDLASAADLADRSRAFAWKTDDELLHFARTVASRLKVFEY